MLSLLEVELKNLLERPEDNLVRAVISALVRYLHPDFQEKSAEAAPTRLPPHFRDLKADDMRWKLSTRHNTKTHEDTPPPSIRVESIVVKPASRDME